MFRWFLIVAFALAGTVNAPLIQAKEKLPPPALEAEPPQLRALLEQGWAAETGRNALLAAALYCEAAQLGSAEGYYRAGLAYQSSRNFFHDEAVAAAFFSAASQLGHRGAAAMLEVTGPPADAPLPCDSIYQAFAAGPGFDLDRYVDELPRHKRRVADLIKMLAPHYSVDIRLALAVASVESNFDVLARSPKNAQGVMQLIPETAKRFNVKNPFNAEQNIRGGLAYLRWLLAYYDGNVVSAVAAYNAGEGVVDGYRGIPPYYETQAYVRRVMRFAAPAPRARPLNSIAP
jgi:soluble lytic murein transglycosylase-like protein